MLLRPEAREVVAAQVLVETLVVDDVVGVMILVELLEEGLVDVIVLEVVWILVAVVELMGEIDVQETKVVETIVVGTVDTIVVGAVDSSRAGFCSRYDCRWYEFSAYHSNCRRSCCL
jgi:hypothetical protein